jgi:hypothetical protein
MQKISSYLYPNRIELLADLAGFTTEYTNVYQRNVKIYNGIDNTIEFDIKNADQKRIDLSILTDIQMNVMDASGNALPNSPYTITPIPSMKGLATVVIPKEDLVDLTEQFLGYSVSALKDGSDLMLYADSRFGAVGKIELVGSAMPVTKADRIYKTFAAEIDLQGLPISHSSSIPTQFYEAVPTTSLTIDINFTGFKGSIWIEATTDNTISVDSFKTRGLKLLDTVTTYATATTGNISFDLDIGSYKYFRVSYQNSRQQDVTLTNPMGLTGKVDSVTVS